MALKLGYRLKDIALVAAYLEKYINNFMRLEVLSRLGGLNITLVGNLADGVSVRGSNVQKTGFIPFEQSLALIDRAKVLVNVRPGFPNGGHERVFYALSRGTAVVSNASTFLEPDMAAHGFLRFFGPDGADVEDRSLALLGDLGRGDVDIAAMLSHQHRRHTWKQRVKNVLAFVQKYRDPSLRQTDVR
jgi:hypothetical protein